MIVKFGEEMAQIRVEGTRMTVKAGALMSKAAVTARQHGLTGLEFAAGIPGSMGGGIVMNAGAYEGEMKQIVESVRVMDRDGQILTLDNDTMEFGYRTSIIKNRPFYCDRSGIAAYRRRSGTYRCQNGRTGTAS